MYAKYIKLWVYGYNYGNYGILIMTYSYHQRTYHHLVLVIKLRALYTYMTEDPLRCVDCNAIRSSSDKTNANYVNLERRIQ